MRYTQSEVDLLQLTWKGSDDDDPPFNITEVKWRGKIVPFVMGATWESKVGFGHPVVTLTVTNRKDRGYAADEPIPLWKEMREAGVRFIGWPEEGDQT